jgi:hypothetical protein
MKHTGGCHCGAVRYEVETDIDKVIECNCSHCHNKGLLLHFADKDKFTLLSGKDNLSEYRFNKKTIHHLFCKTCGVQSFADNDSYPKMAINVRCLDDVDTSSLTIEKANGKDY